MHFTPILLGLVASASAIDIGFHVGWDCSGAASVCTAINPNICCVASLASSARVSWVPVEWNINAQGFGGGGCSWNKDDYTGVYYWFVGRKRGELEEDRNCTGSVKPDTLVLADGTTKYNIVGLDDAKVEELSHSLAYSALFKLSEDVKGNVAACYFCVHLSTVGTYPIAPGANAWTLNNLAGPARRALGVAFSIAMGNVWRLVNRFN
ncbi:hypothetical protein INS49_010630 [Diaporthe citri]|uniref:uncharacterized protein n=1 Tax=Diaporthe citri TaxID=83186 RepID=UPI001C81DD51|nr:uncharacterized protein INS49_010630 [Diaporthe citri]KAG6362400.1 hypothetical protein INS49_010630 [Diaporthe citri]